MVVDTDRARLKNHPPRKAPAILVKLTLEPGDLSAQVADDLTAGRRCAVRMIYSSNNTRGSRLGRRIIRTGKPSN
jgi:hypothetical protein